MASFAFETLRIPKASIREGLNAFNFEIPFGAALEGPNWRFKQGIRVDIQVQTVADDYLVGTDVRGVADLVCDRCAESFQKKIHGSVQALFTADPHKMEDGEGGDLRAIDTSSDGLDVTQEIVDSLQFGLPGRTICKKTCRGLCSQCGRNLNESECGCDQVFSDPRWDALKKLKFDKD